MKFKQTGKLTHNTKVKLKKFFYRNRMSGFKRMVALMLIVGIASMLAYGIRFAYLQYAAARAHVSLLYPEIAQSKYPDGSRFTYYDLTSYANVEKALEIMQSKGMYENYTVEDISENMYVYNYLDSTAQDLVSSARSEGNDYSYVANEYKITFIQPHDYKNKNVLKKIFTPNNSEEFLQTLIDVNRNCIANTYGGEKGFGILTDTVDMTGYDYNETVAVYRTKINSVVDYLNRLENASPGFVSEKHGKGLKDIVGEYKLLLVNKLDSISSFIDTSAISRDIQVATNKLLVNIENNDLKLKKYSDKVDINKYAQEAYDHTFTENLIVVTIHDTNGLYQARPKTAFDQVVNEKHMAIENVEEYQSKNGVLWREYSSYKNIATDKDEYTRLCNKCEELLEQFSAEYEALTLTAREVVSEYQNNVNKNYIKAEITKKSMISTQLFMNMGLVFAVGAVIAFIAYVTASVFIDRRKTNQRKKKINAMKAEGGKA